MGYIEGTEMQRSPRERGARRGLYTEVTIQPRDRGSC